MDIFFHALTGVAIARRSNLWIAAVFGALPDILGMGGAFSHVFYAISHSFIGVLLVVAAIMYFKLHFELLLFYIMHIFLDLFVHEHGTLYLFAPFDDIVRYSGVNWWNIGWIEPVGYILLVALIIIKYEKDHDYRRLFDKSFKRKNHIKSS